MAASVKVVKAQYLSINAVVLSAQNKGFNLTYEAEELNKNASGDVSKVGHPGLKNWRLTGDLFWNAGASSVDATLFPLVGSETPVAIEVRLDSAAVSASNPKYTGTGFLLKYPPFAAQHGQIAMCAIEIGPASDLARAEA